MREIGVISDYEDQCTAGRTLARAAIAEVEAAPDTLPALVAGIRKAAADETGVGIGFLYVIAAAAIGGKIGDFN